LLSYQDGLKLYLASVRVGDLGGHPRKKLTRFSQDRNNSMKSEEKTFPKNGFQNTSYILLKACNLLSTFHMFLDRFLSLSASGSPSWLGSPISIGRRWCLEYWLPPTVQTSRGIQHPEEMLTTSKHPESQMA
jgi:hypothetical protein